MRDSENTSPQVIDPVLMSGSYRETGKVYTMYSAEIRDEFGDVESATLVMIPTHITYFYREHGIENMALVTMKQHNEGNIIASYTYTRPVS